MPSIDKRPPLIEAKFQRVQKVIELQTSMLPLDADSKRSVENIAIKFLNEPVVIRSMCRKPYAEWAATCIYAGCRAIGVDITLHDMWLASHVWPRKIAKRYNNIMKMRTRGTLEPTWEEALSVLAKGIRLDDETREVAVGILHDAKESGIPVSKFNLWSIPAAAIWLAQLRRGEGVGKRSFANRMLISEDTLRKKVRLLDSTGQAAETVTT